MPIVIINGQNSNEGKNLQNGGAVMAEKSKELSTDKVNEELVETLFKKYVKSTIRTLGSTEFYESFMSALAHAQNEIQFSNRRLEKIVDTEWIEAIEMALQGFQNIIENPRNVIREDELIVNVANARKTGSDVVRHLATHASLVEDFDEETGNVRPNKVMQKYREDSIGQVYENRVVFTSLETTYQFVKIRYDALFDVMSEEFGAKLKFKTDMESATESIHMDMFLHIRDIDGALDTDDKNRDIFNRISRLYRILSNDMNSHFAKHMSRYPRVKGSVTKTNVLKKNKNYRVVLDLLDYLKGYQNIGYTIKVVEQNPTIDDKFQQDIFRNTMFQYLLLKNHLEKDKDRRLPPPVKERKKTLKPKFIKEIIEELTEDYDLPDVEIRKVLIEELTKEQLMREEVAERHRLVQEQAERKRQEKERIKKQEQEQKEKLRLEREAEKERRRLEKEAEEQRLQVQKMEREQEDRRRSNIFKKDIESFLNGFDERMSNRNLELEQEIIAAQDFEDAAFVLEETERLKKEQIAIKRQLKRQELERLHQLEIEEKERVRVAKEAEQEKVRLKKAEEEARLQLEEKQRLEKEKIEQEAKDREAVVCLVNEFSSFYNNINHRITLREQQEFERKKLEEEIAQERQKRQSAKQLSERRSWRFGR